MIISGIVMASRPERLQEMRESIAGLPWAEAHHSDATGRLVVTIEARDIDESMERVKLLQALPVVLFAELAQFCSDDEPLRDQPRESKE